MTDWYPVLYRAQYDVPVTKDTQLKRKPTSQQKKIFNLIKELSGQSNILTIPRLFVDFTGSLDTALFLSQVIYWSDRGAKSDGWFFKTYQDWTAEITLSEYQVRKSANTLKKLGILNTRIAKANGSPTVHYQLNIPKFSDSFLKFFKERNLKNLRNYNTETTTEITGPKIIDIPVDYFADEEREERRQEIFLKALKPDRLDIILAKIA